MAAEGAPRTRRAVVEAAAVEKVKHSDGTKTVNGFRVCRVLGEGSFGKVKLCRDERSAEQFAMKVFRKGRLRRQRDWIGGGEEGGMKFRTSMDKVYNEVSIMKGLEHPNCIQLFAILDEEDKDGKMYIVIEYASHGCIMEWDNDRRTYFMLSTGGPVAEDQAKDLVSDLLEGLAYLHGALIAHRDIKPQNLLLAADGVLKIADFGVAIQMDPECVVQGTEGTYYFYSPEVCRPGYEGHDGRHADVWALGVTLWAFLYGSVPFFEEDLVKLLESIAEAKYELPAEPAVSEGGRAFLCRVLDSDASSRPLCPALLKDDWCRDVAAKRRLRSETASSPGMI